MQTSLPPGLATDRVLRLCAGTHYQPMLLLGRGGMGHIYVVLHQPSVEVRSLKVLDFGVARVIDDFSDVTPEGLASPTLTGTLIGSRRYMSPEGVRGERVEHGADIYSLGLTLCVALVGSNPFEGSAVRKLDDAFTHTEGV